MSADTITPARLRELADKQEFYAGVETTRALGLDTAAALRAAADNAEEDERDRTARNADVAKWLAILGEHLTPHQPEALTVIDMALRSYVEQRAEIERLNDQIVAIYEAAKLAGRAR